MLDQPLIHIGANPKMEVKIMKRYIRSAKTDRYISAYDIDQPDDFFALVQELREDPDYSYRPNHGFVPKLVLNISDDTLLELFNNNRKTSFMTYLKYVVSNSDYNKFRNRLNNLVDRHDSWHFKSPRELIDRLADELLESESVAPYPIKIRKKPTSVFVMIHLSNKDIEDIDQEDFDANIEDYVKYLESLPLVGEVQYEDLSDYFEDSKMNPYDRWPHLPIKILPAKISN